MSFVSKAADVVRSLFSKPLPRLVVPDVRLSYEGKHKAEFLTDNHEALEALRFAANSVLASQYGPSYRPVSQHDFIVILFCEAGIAHGVIDPTFEHSLKERGLFPLPNNLPFWDAGWAEDSIPVWDGVMPITTNVFHYLVYMGQIRNKDLGVERAGYRLYGQLFDAIGIKDRRDRQARLLAGIIHGYFSQSNYGDQSVPTDKLINGYQADMNLLDLLDGTFYVWARPDHQPKGRQILSGRQANIEDALRYCRANGLPSGAG